MRCPACAADIPDDAVFCTECGARVEEASVGPTQRLPERERAQSCPRCDSLNPPGAAFCATCGQALTGAGLRPLAEPATPTIALPQPAQLPLPVPLPPPTAPATDRLSKKTTSRRRRANWNALSGGVFFIGLAILFLTGTFWPGILILIGLAGFASSMGEGRPRNALQALIWFVGLALCFRLGFWPWILLLIGVSALLRSD